MDELEDLKKLLLLGHKQKLSLSYEVFIMNIKSII